MRRFRLLPLAVLGLIAACGPAYQRPPVQSSMAGGTELVAQGESVFYGHCHGCHPHGGIGVGRGVTDRPLPAFFVRLQVREGIGQMPAFGPEEISDEELDALIAYLRELRRYWAESDEEG